MRDRPINPDSKKAIYERRVRQMLVDEENFHPTSEPLFPIFELRQKFEEFEEQNGRLGGAYELFLFLLKQKRQD